MSNAKSRYQPIWEQLKHSKHNTVSIVAPYQLHKRIIKAVTKRKDLDLAYKFQCGEQSKKAILTTSIEGNTVTFKLSFQPYLNSLGAY